MLKWHFADTHLFFFALNLFIGHDGKEETVGYTTKPFGILTMRASPESTALVPKVVTVILHAVKSLLFEVLRIRRENVPIGANVMRWSWCLSYFEVWYGLCIRRFVLLTRSFVSPFIFITINHAPLIFSFKNLSTLWCQSIKFTSWTGFGFFGSWENTTLVKITRYYEWSPQNSTPKPHSSLLCHPRLTF